MLGACLSTSVPVLGIVITSIVGTAIKFGIPGLVRIYYYISFANSYNVHNKTKI